ncbi:MAG: hypothetical protein K6A89_02390 [Treponema sp.]|nr:hypothetical protein [Treponema sp.]
MKNINMVNPENKFIHCAKTLVFFCIAAFFAAFLISCDSDISVIKNSDESLSVEFYGSTGKALLSVFNIDEAESGETLFDVQEMKNELEKSGFTDVQVDVKPFAFCIDSVQIKISMKDKNHKSVLFTSGVLSEENLAEKKELKVHLSPLALKKFYDNSDESISGLLDLFLAPVFNDEEMSSEEYEELMGTVYGAEVGKEIEKSYVNLRGLENRKIKLSDLLCGQL